MWIVFIGSMLLGRTFNITSNSVGVDIYDRTATSKPEIITKHRVTSNYRLVENSREARDFLDVSGELSLKIKAGMLNLAGSGSYLKDSESKDKFVEILVKTHYETETRTLHTNTKPMNDWQQNAPAVLGTHFIRSIRYGGDLIASLKFVGKSQKDKEQIKAAIDGGLSLAGTLDLNVKGQFEKLKHDLSGSSSLEIKYYADVPISNVPTTLDGLMEAVKNFPKQTTSVSKKGVPIQAEILPLSFLSNNQKQWLRNGAIDFKLNQLEDKFDDLRTASRRLSDWYRHLPRLPTETRRKVGTLNSKINAIMGKFTEVIGVMDVANKPLSQFQTAFDAYLNGVPERGAQFASDGLDEPFKYIMEFDRLKEDVEKELAKSDCTDTYHYCSYYARKGLCNQQNLSKVCCKSCT